MEGRAGLVIRAWRNTTPADAGFFTPAPKKHDSRTA